MTYGRIRGDIGFREETLVFVKAVTHEGVRHKPQEWPHMTPDCYIYEKLMRMMRNERGR